jgi:hypothetical protein
MIRRYEIAATESGWKLTMYEDDQEAGAGTGGPDDYEWLREQGEDFTGE